MPVIELTNVKFSYPSGFLAVDDVSMSFEGGESVAIIGQNGAGKTTTVKLMNNLYQPSEGTVLVHGENTKDFTTAQVARKVGYVFQNPDDQLFQPTVEKEVAYAPTVNKVPEKERNHWVKLALDLCGLTDFTDKNPYDFPLSIRKFVTIACVIAMNTDVIILDEPTAGQDLKGLAMLSNLISELQAMGKTIITITHDMGFVSNNFSRVIVLADKKKIADGKVSDIFADRAVMGAASLRQPPICDLAVELGLGDGIVTLDDFYTAFKERVPS